MSTLWFYPQTKKQLNDENMDGTGYSFFFYEMQRMGKIVRGQSELCFKFQTQVASSFVFRLQFVGNP